MTRDELFHDPLLGHPPVVHEDVTEDVTEIPQRRPSEGRQAVDRPSQRSLELQRVQDELEKMARRSRRG